MSKDTAKSKRQLISNLIRAGVSVALLAYVISQITWQDRVILGPEDAPEIHWGWLKNVDGARVLAEHDGNMLPIPSDIDEKRVVLGFWTLLKAIDLRFLGLALIIYPCIVAVTAWRWQWLLRTHGLDPGLYEALRLTWMGLLANNVLPGSSGGDFFKGWCIYRRTPGKRLNAVMTVFLDRVLGLVSMMFVGAVALMIASDHPELQQASRHIPIVLMAVLLAGIVFFSGRIRRILRVSDIIDRLPFKDRIQQLDQSVYHFRSHTGTLARAVAVSIPVHLSTFGCVWLLGRALGLEIAPINYYAFLPVIFTAGAVVPALGGLGVLEGLFQYFFSLPGVGATPSGAVALCIVYRFLIFVTSLPGAIPLYREMSAHGTPKGEPDEIDEMPSVPNAEGQRETNGHAHRFAWSSHAFATAMGVRPLLPRRMRRIRP